MTDQRDAAVNYMTSGAIVEPDPATLAFQPTWASRATTPGFSPVPGVTLQLVTGGAVMMSWVTIAPNAQVPRHQHPHEQDGIVLEGELILTIGDETRRLVPGDAYTIPPHLPHAAGSETGCVALDIFSPPREDYLQRLRDLASSTG